jgi:molecular chaperone GrpE (heat shock protein)
MFNLFPQKKSVDELIGWNTPENVPNYIQAQDEMIGELIKENKNLNHLKEENVKLIECIKNLREQQEYLYKENEDLKKILENIAEDGTYEHNNAIKLREENVKLKLEIEKWEKDWDYQNENIRSLIAQKDELVKEVLGLRHLKEENVQLMERVNEIDSDMNKEYQAEIFILKNDIAMWKAKYQILDHNYQGCTRYRDEYKHQLNAANKEIEALRSKLRDYQDKFANSFSYTDMKKLQSKLDAANKEIEKLQNDIVDYVIEKDDKIQELEKAQKHPMYPIHWGGLDPDILKQAKEQSIEEVVDALKGMKTQGFEDYDPGDFEQPVKKEQSIEEIVKDTLNKVTNSENYKNKVKEEKQKQIEFSVEVLLKRATEFADSITGTKAFPKDLFDKAKGLIEGVKVDLEAPLTDLPKTFPNEFQEETTAENLEEKFDKGEDVLNYFEKPWQCPCNKCKETKSKKSWEQAASDLALRVIKLEKKIEELTIGNIYGSNHKI